MISLAPSLNASLLVAAGGAIGAVGRYQLGRIITVWTGPGPIAGAAFPWPTFTVNVIGSLAMGLLVGWLARYETGAENMRLLLGVGLLGGFTTFSAFSLEMVLMIQRGSIGLAGAYAAASVVAAVAALYLGLIVMRGAA